MEQDNVIKILSRLFKNLSIPVTVSSLVTEVSKYPKPLDLNAVGHILDNFGIINRAQTIVSDNNIKLDVPFVIVYNNELVAVTHIEGEKLTFIRANLAEEHSDISMFKRLTLGVGLALKKTESSGEADYNEERRKELIKKYRNPISLLSLLLLLIIQLIAHSYIIINFNFNSLITLTFTSLGFVTTIFLLLQNLDNNNSLIQKICGSDSKKNCNAILTSEAAYLTRELSWSEVGFFYFSGNWITLIFYSGNIHILKSLAILNALALPYTIYSIYYQWKIAKQWCVLCCIIQGILWINFICFLPYFKHLDLPNFQDCSDMIICFTFPALMWILLKPFFQLSAQTKVLSEQLNKFKYNKLLFKNLLLEGKGYELLTSENSLIFGKPEAKIVITMVSNPYCSHCSRMHRKLNRWLKKRPDIRFQVIFSTHNDIAKIKVVEKLMLLMKTKGAIYTKKALNAWYRQKIKKYSTWSKSFPTTNSQFIEKNTVNIQNQWCRKAAITGTPTLFIDGHKLPELYQIDDIKYLI